MFIYQHRRNQRDELDATPREFGVEIDVRSWGSELILQHDPLVQGQRLSEWIETYHHSGLILNLKEEGLEEPLLDLMRNREISNFFFLDQSYPFMVKWLRAGLRTHVAARVSEFESLTSLRSLPHVPAFIWCDSFTGDWAHLVEAAKYAIENDAQLVIVSPELQQRQSLSEVAEIRQTILNHHLENISVCTKRPGIWL